MFLTFIHPVLFIIRTAIQQHNPVNSYPKLINSQFNYNHIKLRDVQQRFISSVQTGERETPADSPSACGVLNVYTKISGKFIFPRVMIKYVFSTYIAKLFWLAEGSRQNFRLSCIIQSREGVGAGAAVFLVT